MASHMTFVSSAAYSHISSQLIDHILNTKVEKPDFDLRELVTQIDVLLVDYDIQLRTKTTISKEFPDLPTKSEASSFAGQVSKHAKLGDNQPTKNTVCQKLSDLPISSVASNFADQVSKHVKLIACQKAGCNKAAIGRTVYCKAHGGGRRCQQLGCTKSAEGKTDNCIGHGGGRRCSNQGCDRAARGKSGLCIKHGGGKRCTKEGCTKSAEGYSGLCISHGGGRRCQFPGCTKGLQGSTMYCKAHGRGKICVVTGCNDSAQGSTSLCKGHGGKRCMFEGGGICSKTVHGRSTFCLAHGGGRRCAVEGCIKGARGMSDLCVRHGRGRRCKFEGCGKDVLQGSTKFCKAHGGGKRCLWGAEGSPYAKEVIQGKSGEIVQGQCERFARGKTGLCTAHSALLQDGRVHGLFLGLASASCPNTPSNLSLPQQVLRNIQSKFFVNSASESSNSIGASSPATFYYDTQLQTKYNIHQNLAALPMASQALISVDQASRHVKRIAKEGATSGTSTPRSACYSTRRWVAQTPEGLLGAQISEIEDVTFSSIDFGLESYVPTPPSLRSLGKRKKSSGTLKQKKNQLGFTELMNAPDIADVQEREEELVIASSDEANPSTLLMNPLPST